VLGWHGFEHFAQNTPIPIYALGGMQRENLVQARRAGAQGVAMLRGAWS
jgi:8-oxo-dGTP diphosphatase